MYDLCVSGWLTSFVLYEENRWMHTEMDDDVAALLTEDCVL